MSEWNLDRTSAYIPDVVPESDLGEILKHLRGPDRAVYLTETSSPA